MKRSSGKRGSRLSGGKSPKVERREDVRIAFPKLDVWKDIVRDRKLKVAPEVMTRFSRADPF